MSKVTFEKKGYLAEIHLINPGKLNVLTRQMIESLDIHCATIESDQDIRTVLLTAEGDRAFCVGADIQDWANLDARTFARNWVKLGHRVFDRIARLPVPVIAVISGHALGGGLELATSCDLRVATPRATFGLPETGVGIVPGWSGTQRLARQIPHAVLKEMVFTGTRISAERAYQIGFLNAIANDPKGLSIELAKNIAATAPQATETTKMMLASAMGEDVGASIEAIASTAMAPTAEKTEGVKAFFEKRKPQFGKNSN